MPRGKLIRDRVTLTLAAAILLGMGKNPAKVAQLLRVSRKSVYKLRAEAITKGWLVSAEVFTGKGVPPEALQEAERRIGGRDMIEPLADDLARLAGFPVAVHICGTGTTADHRLRLLEGGRNAAAHLKLLLTDTHVQTVGVAYGAAVQSVLTGLREISQVPFRRGSPVICVPLRGDAGLDPISTPSVLARRLSRIVNGSDTDRRCWLSPTAVPPVMPDPSKFKLRSEDLRETLETYLGLFPDYAECFGPDGLVNHCQLIITSVGPPRPVSGITRWMFELAGFRAEGVPLAGDAAGIPILDSTRATEAQRVSIEGFEAEKLIGATSETFRTTIRAGGRVAVVVIDDTSRAQCLLEMVQRQMATEVWIDKPGANELRRLLDDRRVRNSKSGLSAKPQVGPA